MFSSFCFFNDNLLALSTLDTNSLPFLSKIVDMLAWSRLTDGCCTTIVACGAFLPPKCTEFSKGLVVTFIGDVADASKWAPTSRRHLFRHTLPRFSVDTFTARECAVSIWAGSWPLSTWCSTGKIKNNRRR